MSEEEIKDGFAPAILVNDEGEIDGFGEVHDPDLQVVDKEDE